MKILNELEKIQNFIEDSNATDSNNRKLSDFDKLCFVQEDLTKLKKIIKLRLSK